MHLSKLNKCNTQQQPGLTVPFVLNVEKPGLSRLQLGFALADLCLPGFQSCPHCGVGSLLQLLLKLSVTYQGMVKVSCGSVGRF